MGYRSNVYLKTTTEGWIMLKQFNDKIENKEERFIQTGRYSPGEVNRSSSGNYKITWEDVKWYDSYPKVKNLKTALGELEEADIPYSYIRIGEEAADIEHKRSYPDDMPSEIECFEPVVDVNDEEYGSYEFIDLDLDLEKGGE